MVQRYNFYFSPASLVPNNFYFISIVKFQYIFSGSDLWRETGEMIGEIREGWRERWKMPESLCTKGSEPSDVRDGPDFVNTPSLSVNKARLIRNNAALFAWNIPRQGIIHSQGGNKTFPAWENYSCLAEKIVFRKKIRLLRKKKQINLAFRSIIRTFAQP